MKRLIFLVVLCAFLPALCGSADRPAGDVLFSWGSQAIEEENRQALFDEMESVGLTVLYQYFSDDYSNSYVRGFLEDAAERGIQVYYLTGAPEWGLDPEGEEMLEQVRRAAKINKKLSDQARLRGVMMDTEPYLTEAWEGHEEEVLACFAEAMGKVRERANEKGLLCILCIPFYYDNDVELRQLSRLIAGCDGLAIMNYSKHHEAEQIVSEVALAGDKPVTVVYELQEPGSHGLKESNTYYYEGVEGVKESFRALKGIYAREDFFFALHDYNALKELEGHE